MSIQNSNLSISLIPSELKNRLMIQNPILWFESIGQRSALDYSFSILGNYLSSSLSSLDKDPPSLHHLKFTCNKYDQLCIFNTRENLSIKDRNMCLVQESYSKFLWTIWFTTRVERKRYHQRFGFKYSLVFIQSSIII